MKKPFTLVYLFDKKGRLLLGMKKRGFGAGRWNGFGGKLHPGESLHEAACREVREEAGLEVGELTKHGILEFEFAKEPGSILEVHVFSARSFKGEPKESEEMCPAWFPTTEIPYDTMWDSDRHWLPLFLVGKKFRGKVLFGDGDIVQDVRIEKVESL